MTYQFFEIKKAEWIVSDVKDGLYNLAEKMLPPPDKGIYLSLEEWRTEGDNIHFTIAEKWQGNEERHSFSVPYTALQAAMKEVKRDGRFGAKAEKEEQRKARNDASRLV